MISEVVTLIFSLISVILGVGAFKFSIYDSYPDNTAAAWCVVICCVTVPISLYFGGVITS